METQKKVLGDEHPDYATSLYNLASLYTDMGRYAEAEPLSRQAAAIVGKALGDSHPDYATHLMGLAALYLAMGRYDQAEPLLRQALEIRKKALGDQHPAYAEGLYGLAKLYYSMGQYKKAEPLYRQSLEIDRKVLGETHPNYATSLNDLAMLYYSMGRYEQAEPLYRKALEIRKKALGETHPNYAASLNNLALVYDSTGRYEQAEPLLRQALEIERKALGEEDHNYALQLSNLGLALAAMKRIDEASGLLLASAQAQRSHLTQNFPSMSDQQKRQFLAQSDFFQSNALCSLIFQGHTTHVKAGLQTVLLSKQLLFEAARQESGALRAAVAAAPPEWQARWRDREQLRRQYATLALATMTEAGHPPQLGRKPVNAGEVRELAVRIEQREEELRQTNPAYASQARLQQVRLEDASLALRADEALIEYVSYRPYDFSARKWDNPHYGAFVLQGGGELTAIELGGAEAINNAVAQFRAEVRGAIDQFKAVDPSMGQIRRSEAQIAASSSTVRELVWQPLEKQLSGIKRVYVAPDGQLTLIPFEALARKDASGWRYLAEDREVIYLGTGRDLGRLALSSNGKTEGLRTAVLIGNPSFDAQPREIAAVVAGLTPPAVTVLAQSTSQSSPPTLGVAGGNEAPRLQIPRNWPQAEVLGGLIQQAGTQLKRLGWSVTTLTNAAAVKEAAEAVQSPRILQFATHGYILDRPNNDPEGWDNPLLRSMLILAGANKWQRDDSVFYRIGRELLTKAQARSRGLSEEQLQAARVDVADGILTAYEVTGMNLQGTELVNLTACETGLGEVTPDGVAGLRQAFLLAGARALTMSMWEVPAEETTQQISDFYDRWVGSEGKGRKPAARYEAFHAAQLAALARARQNHGSGHPFYWAGTIFVGDPGDLPSSVSATQTDTEKKTPAKLTWSMPARQRR
jgi:CHAT domain-containing protein/Tfp pilus assembly protein PilF